MMVCLVEELSWLGRGSGKLSRQSVFTRQSCFRGRSTRVAAMGWSASFANYRCTLHCGEIRAYKYLSRQLYAYTRTEYVFRRYSLYSEQIFTIFVYTRSELHHFLAYRFDLLYLAQPSNSAADVLTSSSHPRTALSLCPSQRSRDI